jgi:hypothetical protein
MWLNLVCGVLGEYQMLDCFIYSFFFNILKVKMTNKIKMEHVSKIDNLKFGHIHEHNKK